MYVGTTNTLLKVQNQYISINLRDYYQQQFDLNSSLVQTLENNWSRIPITGDVSVMSCNKFGQLNWMNLTYIYKQTWNDPNLLPQPFLKHFIMNSGRAVTMRYNQPIFNRLETNEFGLIYQESPVYLPTSNILPQRIEQSIKSSIVQGITTIIPDTTGVLHNINTKTWGIIDINRHLLDKFIDSTQDQDDKDLLTNLKQEVLIYDSVYEVQISNEIGSLYTLGLNDISFMTYEGFLLPSMVISQ